MSGGGMRRDWRRVALATVLAALLLVGRHTRPAPVRGRVGPPLGRGPLGLAAVVALVVALVIAGVAGGADRGEPAAPPALAAVADGTSPDAALPEPAPVGGTPVAAPPGPTKPLVVVLKYTVQPGDTLRTIAEQFGVSVGALLAANQLADPDALAVGQVLAIPRR